MTFLIRSPKFDVVFEEARRYYTIDGVCESTWLHIWKKIEGLAGVISVKGDFMADGRLCVDFATEEAATEIDRTIQIELIFPNLPLDYRTLKTPIDGSSK